VSAAAFEQMLAALDPDRERAGARYQDLHRQLVKFFEWQCSPNPEEQADEVIDRVVRRIDQGERIEKLPAYAHGVARLLLREGWRAGQRAERVRAHIRYVTGTATDEAWALLEAERQQACLDQCLAALSEENRRTILGYYAGERRGKIDGRRALAERLGTDLNALRVRAHRIRARLEACVGQCAGRKADH
jgi:DNA-directed RNA polymerase specialized sigma24 family protein